MCKKNKIIKPVDSATFYLNYCKSAINDKDFQQQRIRNGALDTFIGHSKNYNYNITFHHITATKFDIYIQIGTNPTAKIYDLDSTSKYYALFATLAGYEIFGAPRKSLFARILSHKR